MIEGWRGIERMNLKEKIKKYFTEKPTETFWKSAFFTMFFIRLISPTTISFITMFQVGLVSPDLEAKALEKSYQSISKEISEIMIRNLYKMFEAGQTIAQNNPLIGKIMFYAISAFVWAIYVAVLLLALNLFRYGISYIYRKVKARGQRKLENNP